LDFAVTPMDGGAFGIPPSDIWMSGRPWSVSTQLASDVRPTITSKAPPAEPATKPAPSPSPATKPSPAPLPSPAPEREPDPFYPEWPDDLPLPEPKGGLLQAFPSHFGDLRVDYLCATRSRGGDMRTSDIRAGDRCTGNLGTASLKAGKRQVHGRRAGHQQVDDRQAER